jgi:hypothetical protein
MSRNTKKLVQQSESTVVDLATGEAVQRAVTNVYTLPTEPPYVKMYLDDLCVFASVSESHKKLLIALLRRLDYEGYIILSARARKEMAASLGWGDGAYRNKLNELCKKNLLRRCSTNEYAVNPQYFARGEWKQICMQRKAFQMRITYDERGRTVETGTVEGDVKQTELELG